MRPILLLLIICMACRSGKDVYLFTSFREPGLDGLHLLYSHNGYNWTDIPGSFLTPAIGGKNMRDPSIQQGPDGIFHLVWTSAWKGDKGFGYASSKDLIHWSDERYIPVMEHEPTAVNVWAPELFYDDENNQFLIIWSTTIPSRFPKGTEEEHNNHRLYYTTTRDFVTFSPAKLFFDPGYSVIDGTIVKEANHRYVLVVKDNTRPERDIKVAFSEHATGPYQAISAPFTDKLTEGPSATKVGKEWLIYYDNYGTHHYGAIKTIDFKSFTDISAKVSLPTGHKHGTIFKTTKKVLKGLLAQTK
ncbi:glycoside hydrolase family 43 protein [Chitinophaga sp. LS1]|uniref:glycoside hydrolase family 43 protein n=1 Tax=Chitinophaga sp. LS1 TaxID=3051176 RepID=UPI002AAB209E|nr:glycoside hydrolase family 43 protein [Chitinophaga sp. LS1]WPV69734.1 glycoside hydrolase family 43 protein [Chitinophaga sp. LS1]